MRKKAVILEKLLVEDYAAEGKSIARQEGKVIFIESAVPGDVVDVRLYKNKKDWAEGYPLQFHDYSTERVEPFCPHFGVCGGCQWQMLPYQKQLHYKQKQVEETLKRIGKIPLPAALPIIGAAEEETKFYRNKLEYTFSPKEFLPDTEFEKQKKDLLNAGEGASNFTGAVGFHAKGVFDKVVDIKSCYLQDEPTNSLRLAVKEFAIKNGYEFYDAKTHDGFLRTMQLRICATGEVMVNVVFGYDDKERITGLLDFIISKFPTITTLLYTINKKWNDSLNDLEPVVYYGKGWVIEKLSTADGGEEFQFKIGPKSFFQTNTRQAEKLYRVTRDFAELTGRQIVYDLYCGTGSIGIFLSRLAKKIVGVEMIEAAVNDAIENADLNNVGDAEFISGDVVKICTDDFFAVHGRPDVIISDPPRAGMHEKLVAKILEMQAPIVVYVSCNPATQARDLNSLGKKYEVTKIQPVDMFPHTHHIENVVQLKLRKN
ncbi:MAG: 23S rRNA (uracil(1939)-C(5))-methyltransferase RlmD [Chitinophagaceae bacterium]